MPAAFLAMAAMDFEFADDGLAWNLGLKLLIAMILNDVAATVGTLRRQGRVESFIDALGRRRFAMGVQAVLFSFLATRLLGMLLGFAFGERSRLAFGGPFEFFDAFLQIENGLPKLGVF